MSSGDIEAPLILRMEATLTRLERQMAKGRKVVNDSVNSMQGKFDGMNRHISKSAEASAKTMIRGLDRAEAGYKRVVAAVDPVAAATQRLTGREAALTEAVKRGIITQEEHLRVLKMVRAENTASVAALSRMTGGSVAATAGMRGFLNISGGGRFVLQNTAAQLSDMAVQWEMGTNASRIASQQIPQLLGGFGALGGVLGVVAPLLGVVAAVGIPVGALLYNLGKDAGEGADGLTDLEKALNKAEAAMNKADAAIKRASQGGVEDLLAIYGDVTEKVQGLAQALADIEVRAMVQQVEISLSEALKTELPFEIKSKISIADAIMASTAEEIELVKKEISYLEQEIDNALAPNASSLDLLREYREELALMTGDFANAGSLIDQLQFDPATLVRIRELAELIPNMLKSENFAESADLLAEFRKLAEEVGIEMSEGWGAGLTNAESMLRKVIMHMDESKQLASELGETSVSGGITVAANEALRLARWLGVSLKSAMRLAEMGPQGMPTQGNRGRGSSSGQGQFVSGFDVSEADEFLESYKDPSKGRKGGGRSRDASLGVERQLESLKQQIELIGKSRAEVVVLTAKHKLLNAARQRGLDLDTVQVGTGETLREEIDRQSEAIGRLILQKEKSAKSSKFLADQEMDVKNGMIDAIIEGENLAGTLKNVAKAFARAALEAALFGTGELVGGGKGGGLLGGIFSAIFGKRAGGGSTRAGTPYLVNENTPNSEIFVPSTSGGVLNVAQAQAALRGATGGGGTVIHQEFHMTTGIVQTVRAEIKTFMPQFAEIAKAAVADARSRSVN